MAQLILFTSKLCNICKTVEPIFQELIKEYAERISMEIIDVRENTQKAVEFSVLSVPTILFVKDGKEIHRITGHTSKEKIKQKIEEIK